MTLIHVIPPKYTYLHVSTVYQLVLPVLWNTVPTVQIHVRYATDTRITAESDLGPGMVNVFGVLYGCNSVC